MTVIPGEERARPLFGPVPAKVLTESYAQLPYNAKIGLNSVPPGVSVSMILDANSPVVSGGGGGWVVTPRPGRKGLTSWQGVDPFQLSFSAWFDAIFANGTDVEADCNDLMTLWRPRGDFNAPRHVRVTGPIPLSDDVDWLLTGLSWGPTLRAANGARRQQQMDITLLEFVDPDSVIRATGAARSASTRARIYTVKPGDTLQSIARVQLGDARRAADIRRENLPALRDGRSIKAGMQILIPAGK